MTIRPFDAKEREAIRHALDETLLVEAAAGTGKTTELLARVLNVLAEGRARIEGIVAVTFTEKAAGELKLRLRKGLELERAAYATKARATGGQAARDRLARIEDALARLEEAHVNTIHGFCADLLRERPVEACVDPRFEVLSQDADEALFGRVFARWMESALGAPGEGVRRALRRPSAFGEEGGEDGPIARLRRAAWALATWRDFEGAWTRPPFDREARLAQVLEAVRRVADLTAGPHRPGDYLHRDSTVVRDVAAEIRNPGASEGADPDGQEGRIAAFAVDLRKAVSRMRKGRGGEYKPGVARDDVFAAIQDLRAGVEAFVADADADLAACLQMELREVVDAYQRAKADQGRLDFVDLLLRARDLLRDHEPVRADFQARFARLFVDEFQDTDPIQAEILLLLVSRDCRVRNWQEVVPVPGKLFLVGDPKQAIYRFRRADVGTYWAVRDLLVQRGHARLVRLSTSFRSLPAIQRCINVSFAPEMTGDRATLQAEYEPLAPHRPEHPGQPAVIALPVPEPYGARQISGAAIDASLPDAVGEFVRWLVRDSGWTVTDRPAAATHEARHAIRPSDIAIVFRRFTSTIGSDVTRPYVDGLEARQVPHVLVGGKAFSGREEIATLAAALSAIEWPDDELVVFATLRGALFGFDDRTLLEYRQRWGRLHPFRLPEPAPGGPLGEVVAALSQLRAWHLQRNRVPAADTVEHVLRETRAHAGLVLRPGGEGALANVLHVVEFARREEHAGRPSFRTLVEALTGGDLDASEAPILEEGSQGVRLITAHKAKGLEFPVVILADITAHLVGRQAGRHLDGDRNLCALRLAGWSPRDLLVHEPMERASDRAEGIRVAYVAATRARDLLVVPAVGDEPYADRWVSVLNRALYPPADARRRPQVAPGCPSFGKDTVTVRPDGDGPGPDTVAPGTYVLDATAASWPAQGPDAFYAVTWWDPRLLPRRERPSLGLRHTDLIAPDVLPATLEADMTAFRAWEAARADAQARGTVPTVRVDTVTRRTDAGGREAAVAVRVVRVAAAGCGELRAAGPRFGRLVHEVLAGVPLEAGPAVVAAHAAMRARLIGADDRERRAAAVLVEAVLADEWLVRARAADAEGRCRREVPLTWTDETGTLVEGVVDLAFDDGSTWWVLDFKTDRQTGPALDRYRAQVGTYATAIAIATGKPAQGVVVEVEG